MIITVLNIKAMYEAFGDRQICFVADQADAIVLPIPECPRCGHPWHGIKVECERCNWPQ